MVEDAPQEADAKRQFKYPFAACEIFCCEVEGVYNTLLENDELLDRLFGLLDQPRPLNTMLAGYFARVVGSLLLRRSADLMQFLQRRPNLLPKLVHHVDTTSVAEVLARLVGADDPQGYPSTAALQWLAGTDLLGLLVQALGPASPAEGQANAAEVLAAVARSAASPLTRSMASADFMERLVDAALAPHDGRAATHALNVCIALLEPLPPSDPTMVGSGMGGNSAAAVHEQLRAEAIRCVAAASERLVSLLDDASAGTGELRTSYGLVRTPVGQLRLKAVDLIAALLRTADPGAEAAIMKTAAVQRAMELFTAHPFNNALHGGVAALLTSFEPGTESLRLFLLKEAKLVDWIISAPEEVRPEPNPDALCGQVERPPMRAGYCGHLTQMANRLQHLAENSRAVRDYLSSHPGWQNYLRTRLEPRNKLESVFAWQCGRPATLGGDMGNEGQLYNSGEIGFTALDTATFSREVYQRYGVYDEDDDEEESTPPEWVMELPGELGKIVDASEPFTDFEGADDGGSGDDGGTGAGGQGQGEEGNTAGVLGNGGDDLDDIGVLGPDTMADMQDDSVVLDDEDAAEGLVSLQGGLESLSLKEGQGEEGSENAKEGESEGEGDKNEKKSSGATQAAEENEAVAVAEEGSVPVENGPTASSPSSSTISGSKDAENENEESESQQFNSNVFWKPTFEVSIDDG